MSKRLSSTVLLFLIGIGFGIFSVYSLIHANGDRDAVITAFLYMVPAVVAFGALIMLPFKKS
ncbi:MAG: hypothetical protein PVSMB4_14390 [Ktedonobacterales bacterium]